MILPRCISIPVLRLAITLAILGSGCSKPPPSSPPTGGITSVPLAEPIGPEAGPRFEQLSAATTGISFENRFEWDHPNKRLYQHGYAGGGVCVGDYDGNGLPDLYLVSQTGRDRLYRQVSPFRFEDASDEVGLLKETAWGTGATFVDIDNDNDLDLYVCNYNSPNRLYINTAGKFVERASAFGINFSGASVMAAFTDYDNDGRVDLYLLTNRLYPLPAEDTPETHRVDGRLQIAPESNELFAIQERLIDGETQRFIVKAGQADRLYHNTGVGSFQDVSTAAGITGNHPGLSATWWDYDTDGDADLYVCNDFWDADRLYRNNGDSSFTDVLQQVVPHTPWFSMGSDAADINNDGLIDFLAADMAPTTHFMSKLMMGDMNESRWFLESAEPRQYMRNALYLNTGTERMMEVAQLANIANTDWSWSVKFGDLDNDGWVDLFVTNGTANHSFDPDLTKRIENLNAQLDRDGVTDPTARWEAQWDMYRETPPRREANLAYRNNRDLSFRDASAEWGLNQQSLSFGAILADLDRDGDLDVVASNVGDPVSVYRNNTTGNGVLIRLAGTRSNRFGYGARIELDAGSTHQVRALLPTSGYMSSNEPLIHFGVGQATTIDRVIVRWPSGHVQEFTDLDTQRMYTITEPAGEVPARATTKKVDPLFVESSSKSGLTTGPLRERPFNDYARQPLLPGRLSQTGPGHAWGDIDGDGDDDLFVGGPARHYGQLFENLGGGRYRQATTGTAIDLDQWREDTSQLFIDADADGDLDLLVGHGSIECEPGHRMLRDRLYLNDGTGAFTAAPDDMLPDVADSTGVIVAGDVDADGDLDLFVGARSIPGEYPRTPRSRLLINSGNGFVEETNRLAPGLGEIGLVTGALFTDTDGDGLIDLLVTTEWGPVHLFLNSGSALVDRTHEAGLATRTGWWNGVAGADFDGDGDIDYVITNFGLNTKYHASEQEPALLYYGDLDGSGRLSLVEAKPEDNTLLPVRGLSCSSGAMPSLAAQLPTFRDFAQATLPEIYTQSRLDSATLLRANELRHGLLINNSVPGEPSFEFKPLPSLAQAAPGYGVVAGDFDGDTLADIYFVQNLFTREAETGRLDGGLSLLLQGNGAAGFEPTWPAQSGLVVPGDATGLSVADIDDDGRPDFGVTRNNDPLLVFTQAQSSRFITIRLEPDIRAGNPTGVGARVTLRLANGRSQTSEVYAGSGYMSQSSPALFFGLGDSSPDSVATVSVRWPNGMTSQHQVSARAGAVRIEQPSESESQSGG